MKNPFFPFLVLFLFQVNLFSAEEKKDTTFKIKKDDLVLAMIDSAINSFHFKSYDFSYDTTKISSDSIFLIDDEFVECNLNQLNEETPFDLRYNQYVKAFINLYIVKKRDLSSSVLSLAPFYYPMIESALDRYNLPLELKHLAVVESALNPSARSRVGAQGLWQFMYPTAKMYGLRINSYYDERLDPILATEAACKYLSDLYGMYGDWSLVLAAYNSGPGNVNKAIRRSGGKRNYWEIRKYLPRETRGYVPAFIAVNYMMNNAEVHGIKPANINSYAFNVDTLRIVYPFSFDEISTYLNLPVEDLKALNPQYRLGYMPNDGRPKTLCLPTSYAGMYLTNEKAIFEDIQRKTEEVLTKKEATVASEVKTYEHTVRSGEFLGSIAKKYNCRVSELMAWNNLRSTRINPGDKLMIRNGFEEESKITKNEPSKPQQALKDDGKYQVHVVKSGDTLWDIAKLYSNTSVNDLKRLNSNLNFKRLKPGMKVKVKQIG